jgi:HEAT repeat protein
VVIGPLQEHTGDLAAASAASEDEAASVRVLGYGALARLDRLSEGIALRGLADHDTLVVRRVVECVARQRPTQSELDSIDLALLAMLTSASDEVAEVCAWALGERHQAPDEALDTVTSANAQVVRALSTAATSHHDALVRESAAAALGAIGDPVGLPAILQATTDKATVRRRAVLALAAFEGPEVTAALTVARTDRDWQVRQAAEDLLG